VGVGVFVRASEFVFLHALKVRFPQSIEIVWRDHWRESSCGHTSQISLLRECFGVVLEAYSLAGVEVHTNFPRSCRFAPAPSAHIFPLVRWSARSNGFYLDKDLANTSIFVDYFVEPARLKYRSQPTLLLMYNVRYIPRVRVALGRRGDNIYNKQQHQHPQQQQATKSRRTAS
jgi:hypothetical protein